MQKKKVLIALIAFYSCRSFPIKNLDKISKREPAPEKAAEPAVKSTSKVATEPIPKPATEATSAKYKRSKLTLQQESMNEIIVDENDINNEIF